MKCIFIYNPHSGKGKIAKKLPYIQRKLRKRYEEVEIYATKYRGDMERKIAEIATAGGYDAVIFSGGDGTFNNVLQGLADAKERPALGYIPSGTVNDIAHSLKIPRRIGGALKVILGGRREKLDCMRINRTDYAMYIVAAGMFTNVAYETKQLGKKFLGRIAYGLEGVRTNAGFNAFPVTVTTEKGEESFPCFLVFALNSRSVAGMKINPKDSMSDGFMELALVKRRQSSHFFARFFGLCDIAHLFLRGYKEDGVRDITCMKVKSVQFRAPKEVTWAYDGERGGRGDVSIEVVPRYVELFVPEKLKYI